jgi:hypothetical protein
MNVDEVWARRIPDSFYDAASALPASVLALLHPVSQAFHAYWCAKRDQVGAFPDRADLDPLTEIPKLARYVVIHEPRYLDRGGFDLFCRLAGTHVEDAQGTRMTGRLASDFSPRSGAAWVDRIRRAIEKRQFTLRREMPRVHVEERIGLVESIYAPITDKRRATDAVIGVTIYQRLE